MEKILDDVQMQLFREMLDAAQHIVICPHVNPDGDAVGSTLAIMHWLRRQGKDACVLVPNSFPDFLQWLPGANEIVNYTREAEIAKERIAKADLFLITDLN